MPEITPFGGLEVLFPGDPLSSDGYKFQSIDRFLIARLLQVGAVTHRHDGHAAMVDPTSAPTVAFAPGGAIGAGVPVYVTYTLIDPDGGESLPVAATTLTTPGGFDDPTDAPVVAVDHTTGTLQAGNYSYAITATDGLGGETAVGPANVAVVPTGFANSEVHVSGLSAALASASGGAPGASWRLWRMQGGGPWYLIASGTGDTFTDDGVAGDCTVAPPAQGTTRGTNELQVTVPAAGQPAAAVNFNIYASLDGSFTNPCLLGTYPVADFGVAQTFTDLTVGQGAPPTVSTCLPGANPITSADLALNWLPPAATAGALPGAGNNDGDARIALDTLRAYVWNSATPAWQRLDAVTSVFGRSGAVVATAGDYTPAQVGALPALIANSQQAAAYQFVLADANTRVESTSAAAVNFTIPANATVAFPVGARIWVEQYGAGQVAIVAAGGVTLRSLTGLVHTAGQYAVIELYKRAIDEWVLSGQLG